MPQSLVQNIQHTVLSTKDRYKWINDNWEAALFKQIGGILNKLGCKLLAAGGYSDHIHLLSVVDRKLSIPEYVSKVKSASSFWIHKNIPGKKKFSWQSGYASFSVSESMVPAVTRYIQTQREHHDRRGFQDELKSLLAKHKLKYDERYLWN